ncbi:MAG: hypothetical protein WC554_08360 [Clostridia bacterium]
MAFARQEPRKRIKGRFKVSDVWAIQNGYLQPSQYFDTEIMDDEQLVKTQWGVMFHEYFSTLLSRDGWQTSQKEMKKEYTYKDITLVGIPDGLKDNIVLELKTKNEIVVADENEHIIQGIVEAKDWYITQVKCYLSMYEKEIGWIAQPRFEKNAIHLELVRTVKRNDEWFFNMLDELVEFNKKL